MSKIFVRLSADSLHYEELHEVALFLKNQVSNADISIIAPVLSRFSEAFDDFHQKIEPVHLRHLTQELRATDKDRDRCFSHMRLVMLGFLKSSFAEKREAAQRLNNVFTRFDGVQRESYKKASGMYSLMVNILRIGIFRPERITVVVFRIIERIRRIDGMAHLRQGQLRQDVRMQAVIIPMHRKGLLFTGGLPHSSGKLCHLLLHLLRIDALIAHFRKFHRHTPLQSLFLFHKNRRTALCLFRQRPIPLLCLIKKQEEL